jgi:hypothetical protein
MKTRIVSGINYSATALVPEQSDIDNIKVGDLAPDCFGKLQIVTDIFHRGKDRNGKDFVCYRTRFFGCEKTTITNTMKVGELLRTVALTNYLNSAECDKLEYEMNQ